MLLVGRYASPFVRRVAVTLRLYRIDYAHRPWSVFTDQDEIKQHNPLLRVPALVLDDGETLIDSFAIIDALDQMVGPDQALIASGGKCRRDVLKICALFSGVADKAVSLVYERTLHDRTTPSWQTRCRDQIQRTLSVLEADLKSHGGPWWFGENCSHADIICGCVLTFLTEAHPGIFELPPALAAHRKACEALPEFSATYLPFVGPPATR